MEQYMSWVWLGLIVLFVVIEAATSELVSIWFVAGAVTALAVSLFSHSIWLQCVLFVVVSGLVLVLLRPVVMKRMKAQKVPTNADMVVGRTAVVLQEIDNDAASGRVEVYGENWSARSDDGSPIPTGEKVTVLRIEGVRLIVAPQNK